jgi:fatty-acyl-CoA synthase
VFGVPDDKYGEQVCAWIQARDGSELTAEDVRDYCRGQITQFKIPRHIKMVQEYPMTITGKLQKFVMRDETIKELGIKV